MQWQNNNQTAIGGSKTQAAKEATATKGQTRGEREGRRCNARITGVRAFRTKCLDTVKIITCEAEDEWCGGEERTVESICIKKIIYCIKIFLKRDMYYVNLHNAYLT